jgi:hypothetical protein
VQRSGSTALFTFHQDLVIREGQRLLVTCGQSA